MSTRQNSWVSGSALFSSALAALIAVGCGAQKDDTYHYPDAEQIGTALELENGGLTMEDEAPTFAENDAFADAIDPEQPVADELENDPTVMSFKQQPDAAKIEVALLWGQIPGNPAATTPHDWSGKISINRGALLVRRTVRFDGPTDNLLPRKDPQSVAFTSVTLPHNDGLRLTILDPTPLAPEPLTLTYETKSGLVYSGPIKALLDGPEEVQVDDSGNRFVGVAIANPVDVCQFGMLGGMWRKVAPGRGVLRGVVVNALGDPIGHVKGIYGQRKNGEQVFFGKYINLEGQFRGIFAGKYGDGEYAGKWLHASGEVGALGGRYFEGLKGHEDGGKFIGRWAETSCNLQVAPKPPAN